MFKCMNAIESGEIKSKQQFTSLNKLHRMFFRYLKSNYFKIKCSSFTAMKLNLNSWTFHPHLVPPVCQEKTSSVMLFRNLSMHWRPRGHRNNTWSIFLVFMVTVTFWILCKALFAEVCFGQQTLNIIFTKFTRKKVIQVTWVWGDCFAPSSVS